MKWRGNLLSVWILNVGQGDSLLILFPDGSWGVVDSNVATTSQDVPALALLQGKGADRLAFVCLTHPHTDHFSGLQRILEFYDGRIDELWAFQIDSAHLKKFLEVQHQRHVTTPVGRRRYGELQTFFKAFFKMSKAGSARRLVGGLKLPSRGGVDIDCLSPLSRDIGEYQNQLAWSSQPQNYKANENLVSVVLRLRYGGCTILLSSDAPTKAWPGMWKEAKKRRESFEAEAVKISHHGSRVGFHEEIWKKTVSCRGTDGVVSSGVGYGHPDRAVIEALHRMGVRLHCTNFPEHCIRSKLTDFSKFEGLPERSKLRLFMLDQSSNFPLSPCNGDIRIDLDSDGTCSVHHQLEGFCPFHLAHR